MKTRLIVAILVLMAGVGKTGAATGYPPETKNAALRYWMAFAEMQDAPADKPTQELLEKTAAGEAAWDEAKLAPILDANEDAIQTMQRATRLPECDWGLEYKRGAKASIAYAPRARALARLNTLEGMRQLARGDSESAVNTWLAGVRFSEDLARGGTLIFALMAKSALMPELRMLEQASGDGRLTEAQKARVLAAIRAIPEDGFDWGSAWGMETVTVEETLHEIRSASDPGAAYEAVMGKAVPKQGLALTADDLRKYGEYMKEVETALRQPPARAAIVLDGLQTKLHNLGEVEQNVTPTPQNVNAARTEVMTARADLLRRLSAK
jgi:hypothetical protein